MAILGIALLPILRSLGPMGGALYRSLGGESAGFAWARLGLLTLLLIPPAALMGATLPVLVAHLESGLVGSALARLQAIDTFGAVLGSVAARFYLLPTLGLLATTWVAGGLNLVAAALAWLAGGKRVTSAPGRSSPKPIEPLLSASHHSIFVAIFALSGIAALAFQGVWVRSFGLILGSSVHSFAGVNNLLTVDFHERVKARLEPDGVFCQMSIPGAEVSR